MKKYFFIIAAALTVLAGCKKEEQNNSEINDSSREVHFIVSDDVINKATLSTSSGFAWEAGDEANFGLFTNLPSHAAATGLTIGGDKRADVAVSVDASARKGYLYYGNSYNEVPQDDIAFSWFNMDANQSQASAGVLDNMHNKAILTSQSLSLSGYETSVKTDFEMLTTYACFNIYSSVATDVTVSSVKFQADAVAAGKYLAGKAHVKFPYDATPELYEYAEGNNSVTVVLGSPYSLDGVTDKASANSVFLGVMPCDVTGYTITVNTSEGEYAFHTDGSISFLAGKIKPINLDLKNATTKPGEGPVELTFVYGNPAASASFGKSGADQFMNGAIQNLVYGGVYLFNAGARQPSFDAEKISIVTDASSSSWLHASFENTSNYQMLIKADANTTADARTGYVYLEYNGTRSTNYITINQDAGPYYVVTPTLTKLYLTDIDKDGETITAAATLSLDINGTPSADVLTDAATYGVTLSCGAATATVTNAAGNVQIVFPANATASTKNYTLTATGASSSSISFTQAAGSGGGGPSTPTYSYDVSFCAYADGVFAGFGANASAQGVYLRLTNVKVDGETVSLTNEIVAAVIADATDSVEPTAGEKGAGYSAYNFDPDIRLDCNSYAGSQIELGISTGAVGGIAKLTYHSSDNSTTGYFFVFVP